MLIHVSLPFSILCAANKLFHSQLIHLVNTKLKVFIVTIESVGFLNMLT